MQLMSFVHPEYRHSLWEAPHGSSMRAHLPPDWHLEESQQASSGEPEQAVASGGTGNRQARMLGVIS
jgi:hypothetical protein